MLSSIFIVLGHTEAYIWLHKYLRIWFPRQTCVLTNSCFWPTVADLILPSVVKSQCTILHQCRTEDDWMAYAGNHREYLAEEDWVSCFRSWICRPITTYAYHLNISVVDYLHETGFAGLSSFLWLRLYYWSCTYLIFLPIWSFLSWRVHPEANLIICTVGRSAR